VKAFNFIEQIKSIDDEIALIITIHLYTEYWINRLIEKRSLTGKEILNDHRIYSFTVKLNLIFNMELIPKDLFSNIKHLNNLRNKYSHEINYNCADFNFSKFKNPDPTFSFIDSQIAVREGRIKLKDLIIQVGIVTFGWLNNICITTHRINH
jgi:hypothetical protein